MSNIKKLFLIDAFAIIYRAYFAFSKNPRINSKGVETSAVLGFVNTLTEVLKKENPTHLAVVFDTPAATVRHIEYTEYKANREAMPEGISVALPYIDQVLDAFNIPKIFVDGYEADDVIGTLAKKAEKAGFTTYMMTPDKDFAQLVSENILLYRPGNKWKPTEVWGVQEVLDKFEITQVEQVIDFLGMMGDAVDNIPGLPGVGEKTAKKFLAEYGSMENLFANTNQLKGKIKEKIETNKAQGVLSKKLATILLDVPIELDEKVLEVQKFDAEKVQNLFEELEFRTLAKRLLNIESENNTNKVTQAASSKTTINSGQMDLFAMEEEISIASYQKISDQQIKYQLVSTAEQRSQLLTDLMKQTSVCFDTETTGLNPQTADLIGLAFCFNRKQAFYVHIPEGEEQNIADQFKVF